MHSQKAHGFSFVFSDEERTRNREQKRSQAPPALGYPTVCLRGNNKGEISLTDPCPNVLRLGGQGKSSLAVESTSSLPSTQIFLRTLGQGPALRNEPEPKRGSQSVMGIWLDSGHLSKRITASASEEKINGALGSPEIETNLCTVSWGTGEVVGCLVHSARLCCGKTQSEVTASSQ